MAAAVVVSNLNVRVGKECIIGDASLLVEPGQIYGLLGPSGCGKTTLISCLLGLVKPSNGNIEIFGAKKPGQSGIPGRNVGYMPQSLCLNEYLTFRETLAFYARLYNCRRRMEDNDDLGQLKLVHLLEMEDMLDRKLDTLSTGQKRRVSLCCALMHNPKLLLLDEPTVGIDPLLREVVWDYLRQLVSDDGVTIIVTTHYIQEAEDRAQKVGFMRRGSILMEGCPKALVRQHYAAADLEDVFYNLCYNDNNLNDDDDDQDDDDHSNDGSGDKGRTSAKANCLNTTQCSTNSIEMSKKKPVSVGPI